MSGVFGHGFGRKNSRTGVCVSSVKYSVISCLELRHAKYVYDCVKPSFARWYITFGRVNASDRNTTSGCSQCTSAMHHSQKRNGLVCGLSTRNTRMPLSIQKSRIDLSSSHSAGQSSHSKLIG